MLPEGKRVGGKCPICGEYVSGAAGMMKNNICYRCKETRGNWRDYINKEYGED